MESLSAAGTANNRRSAREIQQQCLIASAIFVAALWLYTRHNDFPFYYHPDEPGKVAQIRDGTRNFNHPLLLLSATELAAWVRGGVATCQEIVEIGRWCSALFAATAVALFSWLGFNRFGVIGGLSAGITLLIQRRLYEHAHFMKEDAALLAGIALTFVAIDAFWRRPTMLRVLLLGATAGLAASGKYIGVVMLPIAAAALMLRRDGSLGAWRQAVAFTSALLLVAAVINYPAVLSLGSLAAGFTGEITRLNSRGGVESDFSPLDWTQRFLDLSPFLLALFLYHLQFAIRNFRRLTLPDVLLTVFPLVLGFILSFSSKQSGRHVLPAVMVAAFLASMAVIRLATELQERRVRYAAPLTAAFLILACGYDLFATSVLDRGFQRDHRRELVKWIAANVPHTATIGVEDRVGIPYDKPRRFCEVPPPFPQPVRGARWAADLGSLDELRASGMTHIAVTGSQADVFVEESDEAARARDEAFQRRRDFYQRLFAEGRLVWSRETGNVGVLNPSLRLYEIAPPASAPVP